MDLKQPDLQSIQAALINFLKERQPKGNLLSNGKLNFKELAALLGKHRTAFSSSRMSKKTITELETKLEMKEGELPERARRMQEFSVSSDETDHSRQLEGFYQLIRPHTDDPGRFVLEPMQIRRTESSSLQIEMYSAHFRDANHVYVGEAQIHPPRFLFGFLTRPRSANPGKTFRSIGMQVDLLSDPPGCFSGVILRGSGKDSVVAYRFAAIKVAVCGEQHGANDPSRLSTATLSAIPALEPPIHRLFEDEGILIGEVSRKNMPRTFALCSKIFKGWVAKDDQPIGMKLQSIRKGVITNIIVDAMGRAGREGSDQGWRTTIERDLTQR